MRGHCFGIDFAGHYRLGAVMDFVLSLLHDSAIACLITLGWCFMFTLPRRYIVICLLITALGFGTREILERLGMHAMVATFFGSSVASFVGVYFAQKHKITPKALIIPSIICLMPGIAAYKAMVHLVQIGYFGFDFVVFEQMMSHFFYAIFIISALVLGISMPGLLFYRHKPIV